MMLSVNAGIRVQGSKVKRRVTGAKRTPTYRKIYAIRFTNYMLTAFSVEATKAQVRDICELGVVPTPKLTMLHSNENDVFRNRGYSLIDHGERTKALELMSAIRNAILTA